MTLLEKLTQIRERAERASPGPWTFRHGDDLPADSGVRIDHDKWANVTSKNKPDAEFIAHAREDLPRLLAALEVSLSRLKDCCICENTNQCWACRSIADITRILGAP